MGKKYRPRHQAQLGRGTPVPGTVRGARDCAYRATQVGLDAITKGTKRPNVSTLRKRSDNIGPQTTTVWQVKDAVHGSGERFFIKRSADDVKKAIANGRTALLAIHYGVFNDQMGRTGDPNFRGGHAVTILDEKKNKKGVVMWLMADSLDDQRRSSIPQGHRWVPRKALMRALIALGNGGSRNAIYAGVFSKKKVVR